MVDILATGATGGKHMDKMEDVRKVFETLCVEVSLVSCHLESIQVGQALDRSIKEEHSDGSDEKNIKIEVIVKSEDKNSAEVEVEVEKPKILGTNLDSKKVTLTKSIQYQVEFTCNLCLDKFKLKQSLVRHIRSVHDQIKNPCNLCPKKFNKKQHLVRHIRAVHEHLKFPCNLCSQKFTQKQQLVKHIRA